MHAMLKREQVRIAIKDQSTFTASFYRNGDTRAGREETRVFSVASWQSSNRELTREGKKVASRT